MAYNLNLHELLTYSHGLLQFYILISRLTKLFSTEIKLNSAEAYNNHVRNIHGVKTEVREEEHSGTLNLDQGNTTQESSNNEGITKVLNVMVPTLKSISAQSGL